MLKNTKYILLILSALFISCSGNDYEPPETVNLYGNPGRTNTFEHISISTGYIREITPDFEDTTGIASYPLILKGDKILYPQTSGRISILDMNDLEYSFFPDSSARALSCAADSAGNIYVLLKNGTVYSYNSNKQNWKFDIRNVCDSPAIYSNILVDEYGIIAAEQSKVIFKLDFNGNLVWKRFHDDTISRTFASDAGHIVYFVTSNTISESDTLFVVEPNGYELLSLPFDRVRLVGYPVVHNGKIYLTGVINQEDRKITNLYCIGDNGDELWKKTISGLPKYISVSDKGEVFVVSFTSGIGQQINTVYSFGKGGETKDKLYMDVAIASPLIIGERKIIFSGIASEGPGLFLLNRQNLDLYKSISLVEYPDVNMQPGILENGAMVLCGLNRIYILALDDTPFDKLLP